MAADALTARAECPRCRSALGVTAAGKYRCPACRRDFYFFPVEVREPDYGLNPLAPVGSRCAEHNANPAEVLCERCGDFLCELCRTPIEGRIYCPRCFDLLCRRGAFRFSHVTFTSPDTATNLAGLSYLGVLVPGLNVVLAGLAIFHGLTALKRIRAEPDLPGRGRALLALGAAGLNLVLSVLLVGFLVMWGGR